MEKQLSVVGYWLGLICTVLALVTRLVAFVDATALRIGPAAGTGISYVSFFRGAMLFFLLAIASWCRTEKS